MTDRRIVQFPEDLEREPSRDARLPVVRELDAATDDMNAMLTAAESILRERGYSVELSTMLEPGARLVYAKRGNHPRALLLETEETDKSIPITAASRRLRLLACGAIPSLELALAAAEAVQLDEVKATTAELRAWIEKAKP